MRTILLISPYWREQHRWMVSSYKLADLWQRLGYRVIVACMGTDVSNQHAAISVEKVSETLEIHRKKDIFLKDPWNYGIAFGFSRMVNRIVQQEKPDVIVVNKVLFWTSLASVALRLRGHRVIQLTDALVGITWWPRGPLPKLAAAIYAWTIGWVILKCARTIVFFHPQPVKLLRRLGIAHKCEVIPTGIEASKYGKASSLEPRASSQANAPATGGQRPAATVTYVGRLESVKGVDDFVAAVVPLKKEFPQITIQVVGWFRDHHPLVQQYDREVVFTGLREDIPAILDASDIFVLPSHSEGLSNALMEAMASGCACVASDVGGNAFLIQNGVSGFLYPAGDREALQSHLRRLLQDPAKRRDLGIAARKRIEEQFDWTVVGNQYQALFAESTMNNF